MNQRILNSPDINLLMWKKAITEARDGTYIAIDVSPGSSNRSINGYDEWRNRIKVSVKAEARDGRANTELISLLAEILEIPTGSIQITSGQTSGQKRVLVNGMGVRAVTDRLGEHLGP